MGNALIDAARKVWPFPSDPLDMGVEDGIVWAIVKAPYCGINGYVLIPAEGHPWSPGFPRGEDQERDSERSRKMLRLFMEVNKRKPDMGEAIQEAMEHPNYEPSPDYSLDDFVEVHGGVTYYQHPWLGFDTAHAFDVWGPEYDGMGLSTRYRDKPHEWDRHWTPELVIEEAKSLARQIAEIGRLEKQLEIQEDVSERGN